MSYFLKEQNNMSQARARRWLLPPYSNCQANGEYFGSSTGRYFIKILGPGPGEFVYTQYARYLLEVSIGRKLSKGMTVDHVDGDKTNDMVSNLAEVSKSDNSSRSALGRSLVRVPCSNCGSLLELRRSQVKVMFSSCSSSWVPFQSCSRTCGNILAHKVKGMTPEGKIKFGNETLESVEMVGATSVTHKYIREDFIVYSTEVAVGDPLISINPLVPNSVMAAPVGEVTRQRASTRKTTLDGSTKQVKLYESICKSCNNSYKGRKDQKFCSLKCSGAYHTGMPSDMSKEKLEALLTSNSFLTVGKLFGVSDNAIRKWCKNFLIDPIALNESKKFKPYEVDCSNPSCFRKVIVHKKSRANTKFCSATCGSRSRAIDK